MVSAPSPDQTHRRVPRAVFLLGGAALAAVSIAAVFETLDGPVQIVVAVAVGAASNTLFRDNEDDELKHLTIVGLSIALGFFATWTVMLLRTNSHTSVSRQAHTQHAPPDVQILSPPVGIPVGEKFTGVRGTATDLPQGDVIWLMSQTVGESGAYLMGEPCAIAPTGQWSCPPVYFGTDEPNRQHYNILVRLLDGKTQQQAIEEWGNARSHQKNDLLYPTPIGKALGTIEVHRIGPP